MARKRVNTKFVIILGVVVLFVVGGGLAVVFLSNWRERNPVYLLELSEKAEKAGDTKNALLYLGKAAARSQASHQPGTDKLFVRLGDKFMAASDAESANYEKAIASWRRALQENPRNVDAMRRILLNSYKETSFFRLPGMWNTLEDSARRLLELDPKDALAHAYRAEALFEVGRIATVDAVSQAKMKEASSELDQATALDPTLPEAVIVRVYLLDYAGARAAGAGNLKDSEALRKQALDLMLSYIKSNPNEPKVTLVLARLYLGLRLETEARNLLETACAAHPDDPDLIQLYADYSRQTNPAKSEALLKSLATAMTTSPEGYLRLASFYRTTRKIPESIAAYKEVAARTNNGGGIQAKKNMQWELEALYQISWLYMDQGEIQGIQNDDGRNSLADAASFIDRLRSVRPGYPAIDVLDGRLQLIRQNNQAAIDALRKADTNLGGAEGSGPQWIQIKMMLAQAFADKREWGTAISFIDQVIAKYPHYNVAVLRRASLLVQIGQFTEALAAADNVLREEPDNDAAKRIKANAYLGLGQKDKYEQTIKAMDSTASLLEQAKFKVISGEPDTALEILKQLQVKEPDNLNGQLLTVLALTQLHRDPEALTVVKAVLTKHPDNTQFKMIQASLEHPGAETFDAQLKVIQGIPDDYSRNMALAQLYAQAKNLDKQLESLQAAEKAFDALPDRNRTVGSELVDRIFGLTIQIAMASGQKDSPYWKQAQSYVQKAERLDLDGVSGKLYQGRLEMARGDKKTGVQTLEQAVAARPDFSLTHTILGQAYYETERYDQALEEFRKAIEIKPDNVRALKGAIAVHMRHPDAANQKLALNYLKTALIFARGDPQLQAFSDAIGDPAEAIRVREQTYKNSPNNDENAYQLAFLYVRDKKFPEALDIFLKLSAKAPNDLNLADNLARSYREAGKTKEALDVYQKFVTSDDPKVRYAALLLQADMYRSLNQVPDAVNAYKLAVDKQPAGTDEAQRRLADMYFDIDDMKNAQAVYQQLFDATDGKDVKVLRRLVESMVRQDSFTAAEDLLNTRILKQRPDDPEGLVLLGFSKLRQRKAKEAIEAFDKVLEKNNNSLDALHYRAFAQYYLQGDLEQAAKDLIRVRDQNPNAINSRLLLARVYRLARKFPEASKEYADVIELRLELVQARVEYADFLLALVETLQKLSPNAQDEFSLAVRTTHPNENIDALLANSIKLFPDQPVWRVIEGNLLALRGNPDEAQRMLADAFKASNENPAVASAYLSSLLQSKNYEEVITLATRIMPAHPDFADYYIKRGAAYAATQRIDEALADYDKAMALTASDSNALIIVVRQVIQTIPPDKAIGHFSTRLAANPKDVPIRIGLAQALLSDNHLSESVQAIEPLLNDASQPVPVRVLALRIRGLAHYQNREFAKALEDYKALLRLVPDDLESLNNIAFMLGVDMDNPKDALEFAEKANKILRTKTVDVVYVNNGNLYDTYGWIKYLNGDTDTALRELNRSTQIEPLPITYIHLAKIYLAKKQMDDARRSAKEAVRLATLKKDPLLPTAQQLLKDAGG